MLMTALLMGLAGGLHCAGMCSPLVLAVTARNPFLSTKLLYNAGRIFTYGMLGGIAATLGRIIPLGQYQQVFAFAMGATLLLLGFGAIQGVRIPIITSAVQQFTGWLKVRFGKYIQQKNKSSIFLLGVLNGLLPCGLTYMAMSYCLILEEPLSGVMFMLIFGMGTLPVMVGIVWVIGKFTTRFSWVYSKVTTMLLIAIGLLIMVRAFNNPDQHMTNHLEGSTSKQEILCN